MLHPFIRRSLQTLAMTGVLLVFLLTAVFFALFVITLTLAMITGENNVGVDFPIVAIGDRTAIVFLAVLLIAGAFWASRLFHWRKHA
jgi:hypothetical protein